MTESRAFDLNIQKVLEHWTVSEALREVIANALDEYALTETAEPHITEDARGDWHVRDFGRGLRYEHFTQNENPEKLAKPNLVIGKFGVGLNDSLATFDRHGIGVTIHSQHADITVEKQAKHGFQDVPTLHAVVGAPVDPGMVGTDFVLTGLSRADVERAKDFFLRYSDDTQLESTNYGSVLARDDGAARIYVNGLRVAEEPNFLFSYNITSLNKQLRAALNRERSNVGRQAYSDRVKAILLACESSAVADPLAEDLGSFDKGSSHDETGWLDVATHACRILNAQQKVVFASAFQLYTDAGLLNRAQADGYRIVIVPENVAQKLPKLSDLDGNAIRDLSEYREQWNQSFDYEFVALEDLNTSERAIFDLAAPVLGLVRPEAKRVKDIRVSTTMRLNASGGNEALGVWDSEERQIVIKRDQLKAPDAFLGTLLHEIAHSVRDAWDVSQPFEEDLTRLLGKVGAAVAAR